MTFRHHKTLAEAKAYLAQVTPETFGYHGKIRKKIRANMRYQGWTSYVNLR